jgi:hypothetical protein
MKAKLIKPWEEDATHWPPERKAAIRFARQADGEETMFCVHPKGTVFEGAKAQMLVAIGIAEQIEGTE